MKIVRKKILPQYFDDVDWGFKRFELRKDEDDIQVGDFLVLNEWDNGSYTGRRIVFVVTYVLRGCPQYGLAYGYCIIDLGNRVVNLPGKLFD